MSGDLEVIARRVLPLIDLTSLNDSRDDDVVALCRRAATPAGDVAAVCTWPCFLAEAARCLAGSPIRLAGVINFPDGGSDIAAAVREAKEAVAAGAGELDLVMPFEAWLAGERALARDLIAEVKAATNGRARLKVILETGALGSAENAAAAGQDAVDAGADFLKTSTGKRQPGATPEAAKAMLEVIRDSGGKVGFKASGGIRTTGQAGQYLTLADRILGIGWAGPETFRIGASSLLSDVLDHLQSGSGGARNSDY